MPPPPGVQVLVCVTCRGTAAQAEPRAGAALLDGLRAADLPAGVVVTPAECLSNCTRGCTIALRGDGRWTYVYGNLDPAEHIATIADGVARYHATADGVVPWRERPDHFRKNCIARIPPLETPA